MKKFSALLLASLFSASCFAADFNADGIQDALITAPTSFTIKHNRAGVVDSVVSISAGWTGIYPAQTDALPGDDVVVVYRNSVVFYHDTTKTKRSKSISSATGTNPWTIPYLGDFDGNDGADLLLIASNLNQPVKYEIVHDSAAANDFYNTYYIQSGNVGVYVIELDGNPGAEIFAYSWAGSGYTPSVTYHNNTSTTKNQPYTYAGWNSIYFQDIAGLGRNQVAWFYPGGVPGRPGKFTMTYDDRLGTYRYY